RERPDIKLVDPTELIAAFPEETRNLRNPLSIRVNVSRDGKSQKIGVVPDFVFGIGFPDGSRRCLTVEIDRGTMPISRSDLGQTSFERKMLGYLASYADRLHERQFGWKTFRVLTVTTDHHRLRSMLERVRHAQVPQTPGPSLFWFALRGE